MTSLQNKIDFAVVLRVEHANPNGDPLNGNRPRTDYNGYGEITDVCLKRKIRDRLQDAGLAIFVQSDDRKNDDATSLRDRADKALGKKFGSAETRSLACEKWMDVRAFGQLFALPKGKKAKAGDEEGDTLQEKSFERLGGTRTIPIDVRLVAATNRNLTQMMGDKLFRSDLYYRLKVFPIVTTPLRDHPEDIPILARHFTKKYAAKMDRQIEKIPSHTMRALVNWPWPGNVRELENFIERSVILSGGPSLRAPLAELRANIVEDAGGSTLEEMERNHILRVFRETGGVISTAATRLGVPRTTLNAMMKKLGISRSDL